MELAKTSIFDGTSFKLDYLTKPNGLEDFGFGSKVKMADRVQSSDTVFVVAYPYFNVNGTASSRQSRMFPLPSLSALYTFCGLEVLPAYFTLITIMNVESR